MQNILHSICYAPSTSAEKTVERINESTLYLCQSLMEMLHLGGFACFRINRRDRWEILRLPNKSIRQWASLDHTVRVSFRLLSLASSSFNFSASSLATGCRLRAVRDWAAGGLQETLSRSAWVRRETQWSGFTDCADISTYSQRKFRCLTLLMDL